ncbi:hypothetical protein EYC80_006641 [Monilinia laxa]|uniref:Autophagy-related protein n=1 Tax=Monilinia laxa TaxID=61186 RepID=A0A5N6JSK0_MONLA|nr:hypothetical protein EYC80_006641 [Monilinia laxa]
MTVIFVTLGSAADYGNFGRWLLLFLTIVCWACQYGLIAIKQSSQWPEAMVLYIVSYISYGATLVFFSALFPRLARYMPHVRKARDEDLKGGKINQDEYNRIERLSQAATSILSTFGFWYIQKYFGLRTKSMFMITNVFSVLIPLYGMVGLWPVKVGYHHVNDFWVYNIVFGLLQAPYYSYSQTMMSEITPRGYEGMFSGLFGITNRASSIIGPNVIQAIIDSTNSNWMGFPFLFALCALAGIIIWFVDVEKGREDSDYQFYPKNSKDKLSLPMPTTPPITLAGANAIYT